MQEEQVCEALESWVLYQQPMMEKLKKETGDARLIVLDQAWASSGPWEERMLQLTDQSLIKREVIILSGKAVCWYARTIIPENTYYGDKVLFQRLEKETLGAIIFGDKRISRDSFLHYRIDASSEEYHWLDVRWRETEQNFQVRLSQFQIDGVGPFFLIEILLPGLLRTITLSKNP